VQSLLVVDLLYKLVDVLLGFLEVAVILQVDLFQLEGPEEALGLGVLVRVSYRSHADPRSCFF
jgi:hypothetical protein